MHQARTVEELRLHADAWRALKRPVALVPTMGALHAGHLALVERAKELADHVVVSIFVNPTQFGPDEDFAKYPRQLEGDLEKLHEIGADLAYTPSVEEMYPDGFATTIRVGGPAAAGLEDAHRPEHFDGVATVVAKLFTQCLPSVAVFGEKDYQQLLVIRRMVRDLDLPVTIVGAPTVREADGLALSSRNAYLSPEQRAGAPALYQALTAAADAIRGGADPDAACREQAGRLEEDGWRVDYLAARDAETLQAPAAGRPLRLLAAARLGAVRLIDNIAV
ncbi:MAG TPA: pantoate--beta-alanine ligase [Thermopetrobacter sp.]|nr:pantoate--beta-alanine ligase [Thermopetrobacter sp.]